VDLDAAVSGKCRQTHQDRGARDQDSFLHGHTKRKNTRLNHSPIGRAARKQSSKPHAVYK
jgi:hypothetical protein